MQSVRQCCFFLRTSQTKKTAKLHDPHSYLPYPLLSELCLSLQFLSHPLLLLTLGILLLIGTILGMSIQAKTLYSSRFRAFTRRLRKREKRKVGLRGNAFLKFAYFVYKFAIACLPIVYKELSCLPPKTTCIIPKAYARSV